MIAPMNIFYLCTFILLIGGCLCVNEQGTSSTQDLPGSSSKHVPPEQSSSETASSNDVSASQLTFDEQVQDILQYCQSQKLYMNSPYNVPPALYLQIQSAASASPRDAQSLALIMKNCEPLLRKEQICQLLPQQRPIQNKKTDQNYGQLASPNGILASQSTFDEKFQGISQYCQSQKQVMSPQRNVPPTIAHHTQSAAVAHSRNPEPVHQSIG